MTTTVERRKMENLITEYYYTMTGNPLVGMIERRVHDRLCAYGYEKLSHAIDQMLFEHPAQTVSPIRGLVYYCEIGLNQSEKPRVAPKDGETSVSIPQGR